MQETTLVIVESPTKARTIKKFLPEGFIVEASVGHIRDLPQTAADVPKEFKGQEWARIGINVEADFAPLYVTPKDKSKLVTQLKKLVKEASVVYLATDEDREGESISWHLVDVLKPKNKVVKRLVFHEITKDAIQDALSHPREIDMDLVRAQETRRVLDRLYGFTLSPLLWKKIAYGLSAGRVQSPGLRLIVQREFERVAFKKSNYWDLSAQLLTLLKEGPFEAKIQSLSGKRIASGKDFDPETGKLKAEKDLVILDESQANDLRARLEKGSWKVLEVNEKEVVSRPSIPFITSTLQQEANRKLGLSSRDAMRSAQKLYEEGFITYMRTDSPTLSSEAISASRTAVEQLFGKEYLSPEPRQFQSKNRSAQEAHEAIRPAGSSFVHPDDTGLSGKDRQLYEMIWKRTIASQMAEARKMSMAVRISSGDAVFQANGSKILFPGFLRAYVEGSDDPDAALEDKEVILPNLVPGQELSLKSIGSQSHETKPPARYTEASLIQRLEKEGIGRPSTYASIISVLFERTYVRKIGTALAPTYTGICVIQFLEKNFNELVEYSFTSSMEDALDDIAEGKLNRSAYLKSFYLGEHGLKERVESRDRLIKPNQSRSIVLPQLEGSIDVKIGRFGPYVVAMENEQEIHASIPEDIAPAELTAGDIAMIIDQHKNGPTPIGTDPETGLSIYCLTGRFGHYVQLGEVSETVPKPKRATLPKGIEPSAVDIATALKLLSLPRTLGKHPQTGMDIATNLGRFGPFVVHEGIFRSLKKDDDVYTITLARALELLAEERFPRGAAAKIIKDYGEVTAKDGSKVMAQLSEGKYGLYIKAGDTNISLPEELKNTEAASALALETIQTMLNDAPEKKKKPTRRTKKA